ncbi:PREDICTED: uncharacterized protein LOC105114440 isoform X2 [Populus euphratica]|uniref:Uncharacterized protein LOC105114440 isoform X2 n=1 Tax=Populus euphratica TaxID=75702 RepID=A0AAJ6TDU1_POPEU|nr:PREDICTED: uncharacterized protein LOC105114440 isoform X2 [Populus euphratica]
MDSITPLAPSRIVSKSKHRKQWNRERRETMERLKTDMIEIGEGQKLIREGQREIRQKFEEIGSECRRLKEETMNIAKQSDYNQVRINLMFRILKAREDNNFAHADHLTGLLREEMEKREQGKGGLVG